MPLINTILVPTDFSVPAQRALAYARDLADAHGASLHLLHVIEDPFAGANYMGMVAALPEGYFEHLDQQSRAHLESLLNEEERIRYRAVLAIRLGHAATEILDYVRQHGAIDLIVIATAGRGVVARLMMGSVTERVVRAAACPVLTVHAHDRAEAAGAPAAA